MKRDWRRPALRIEAKGGRSVPRRVKHPCFRKSGRSPDAARVSWACAALQMVSSAGQPWKSMRASGCHGHTRCRDAQASTTRQPVQGARAVASKLSHEVSNTPVDGKTVSRVSGQMTQWQFLGQLYLTFLSNSDSYFIKSPITIGNGFAL